MASTVTVACKIPSGLVLRIMEAHDFDEPVLGGGTRTVKLHRQIGDYVQIKGNSAPHGIPLVLHGGYALTPNVDADFWAKWLEQNAGTDMVKNNLIYALAREDSAAAKGREQAEIRSGLERLNPEKLPKTGVEITTADLK
jgi:hypothetical protein